MSIGAIKERASSADRLLTAVCLWSLSGKRRKRKSAFSLAEDCICRQGRLIDRRT